MNHRPRTLLIALAALLALVVAACGGTTSASVDEAAAEAPEASAAPISLRELTTKYTRYGPGPYELEIDLTYVPREFFAALGQDVPAEVESAAAAVFLLKESVHDGDLPEAMADVVLLLPGGKRVAPTSRELVTDGYHHRTYRLLFPIDVSEMETLELAVLNADGSERRSSSFRWILDRPAPSG